MLGISHFVMIARAYIEAMQETVALGKRDALKPAMVHVHRMPALDDKMYCVQRSLLLHSGVLQHPVLSKVSHPHLQGLHLGHMHMQGLGNLGWRIFRLRYTS